MCAVVFVWAHDGNFNFALIDSGFLCKTAATLLIIKNIKIKPNKLFSPCNPVDKLFNFLCRAESEYFLETTSNFDQKQISFPNSSSLFHNHTEKKPQIPKLNRNWWPLIGRLEANKSLLRWLVVPRNFPLSLRIMTHHQRIFL